MPLNTPSSEDDMNDNKSPKEETILNSLQDEQNNLIEQRIHDQTANLRNSSIWPTNFHHQSNNNRVFTNLDQTAVTGGQSVELPPIFTSTISSTSCMRTSNRSMSWFNRGNVTNEGWSTDFSQGITFTIQIKNFEKDRGRNSPEKSDY